MNQVGEQWEEDFPLAVTLVQFSLFSLRALRQGRFTRQANTRGALFPVFADFYSASLFELFASLRAEARSLIDYPPIKKTVQEHCLRNAPPLLRAFKEKRERLQARERKQA